MIGALLGCVLAVGVMVTLSPWFWPRRARRVAKAPQQLSDLLAEGGFAHVAVRVLVAGSIGFALAGAAIAWLATRVPALAILMFVVGLCAPAMWLKGRAVRLAKARRGLWPDVCDLLISSVRAGMSLPDAVAGLAEAGPDALRPAFRTFSRDLAASGHFDASVLRLKTYLSDPTADRIVETLRMARQVGGTELTPVLRALSSSVRAEAALRAEVESRQSWTRGAAVLGVIAPWVIVALLALRPEGAAAYASPEGMMLLLFGAVVSFLAYRVMLRIGRLPEPRRWFA